MPRSSLLQTYSPVAPAATVVMGNPSNYKRNPNRRYSESTLLKRIPLEKLMDLKIDFAFKQLFGNEKNKEITVVFLNAFLQKTGRKLIKDITFENVEEGRKYEDDKSSRLDLLVTTENGEKINVEIQFTDKYEMIKRSIYYWAGIYRGQMQKSMSYMELKPVIAINIMNFNEFEQSEQFHTMYHLYEDEENFLLTDVMEFHFIEMPKLMKAWKEGKLDPWNDVLARWLLMLGMVDHRNKEAYDEIYHELEEIAMKDESLRSAFHKWEELSMNKEEYAAYESRLKYILDEEAAKREAELRFQEGVREAEEKGMEKGIEKGIVKGIEKGMEKGIEKGIEKMAYRLLKRGMPIVEIADITQLTEERILEIQQELQK